MLTREHAPLIWKYDLNPETNPYFMERLGVNAAFNAGAIKLGDKYCLVARVEGSDRKSFFAVAESDSPVDGFRFRDYPILLPDTCPEETNVYDMRLTKHEDGWIYGVFCSESKDLNDPDLSAAVAAAGIVRTRDLEHWERLPNLVTRESPQQRNVCLLPEFVDGKYAFFTRPMDGFIDTGSGGGIGFGLCEDVTHAVIDHERITSRRKYHKPGLSQGEGPVKLTLAAVFGDDMVLQRDVPVSVWGAAPAGAAVSVSLNGLTAQVRSGTNGRWRAELPPAPAGGPFPLTVSCGSETVRRERVYRGEVWLAGGQSNMELALKDSQDGGRAVRESTNPRLHFYAPAKVTTPEEAERVENGPNPPRWHISGPDTAGELSAVAWYAGRTLTEHLPENVHVGVLTCCWGGTYAHCWLPREELEAFPEGRRRIAWYDARVGGKSDEEFAQELEAYQLEVDAWNGRVAARRAVQPDVTWEVLNEACGLYPWPPPAGRTGFQRPGNLYDSMLSRLAPYALRGFCYYQGEQDEEWPEDYFNLLTHLIRRWRRDWGGAEKPFLLLQLPMYISKADFLGGDPMRWPVLRKAQSDAARVIPGVELAVLADCGEFDNIHPADKRTPGVRLGLLALETVYHLPVAGRPPMCVDVWREGSAVLVRFDHAKGGLRLVGGGFQLAGADGVYHDAEAQVTAETIVQVTSSAVPQPAAVRYAWYSFGPAGLYGGSGLAAAPLNKIL